MLNKNFFISLGLAFEEVTVLWSHLLYRILRFIAPLFLLLASVAFMVISTIAFIKTYGVGILLLSVLITTFIVSVFGTAVKKQNFKDTTTEWKPTHRHVDGGEYKVLRIAEGRTDNDSAWVMGVVYEGSDGKVWWTGAERWNDRFVPIIDFTKPS